MNNLGIDQTIINLFNKEEKLLEKEFKKIDEKAFLNSLKVIKAFKKENISESDFASSTGYGYNDIGRD